MEGSDEDVCPIDSREGRGLRRRGREQGRQEAVVNFEGEVEAEEGHMRRLIGGRSKLN